MQKGTRSQVKEAVRRGYVTVNGITVRSPDQKVDEASDIVCFCGEELRYRKYVYYMLNKPAGVVSATEDSVSETVLGLLKPEDRRDGLFPAGRLDKDTEGFLLITDDGVLAHRLLSPKRHVDKTYRVELEVPLSKKDISALENGVDIGEERLTLPASVSAIDSHTILLTLHEGKYHQVKRMLMAVGNRVTGLKRVSFGGVFLDGSLLPGEYRPLTEHETEILCKVGAHSI